MVIDLIGQLSRDVIGRLSVKPYWLNVIGVFRSVFCHSSTVVYSRLVKLSIDHFRYIKIHTRLQGLGK